MIAALDDVPVIADALVGAGIGALIGSVVAQRHQRRGGRIPHEWIVTRWTLVGALAVPIGSRLLGLS